MIMIEFAERRVREHIVRRENDHPADILGNRILIIAV